MKTYLDHYQETIEPQLKKIDLFIKTQETPYPLDKVAELLQISKNELETIMSEEQITSICNLNFFIVMKKGSSAVCQMFARELNCGTPHLYTIENISYIYNLEISKVVDASQKMGIKFFTSSLKKHLFQLIPHQS